MRDSRYLLAVLAAGFLFVLALSLTGCGSTDSTDSTTADSTQADDSATYETAEESCERESGEDCTCDESGSECTSGSEEIEDDPTDGNVSKSEYGKAWPLTVDSGTVSCEGSDGVGEVWFTSDEGTTYAVNGLAMGVAENEGRPEIDEIWKSDGNGGKISIEPVMDEGHAQCV